MKNGRSLDLEFAEPDEPGNRIAEEDARALVRLLGAVCTQSDEHLARKVFLLNGLCELIGASAWVSNPHGSSEGATGEVTAREVVFQNTNLARLRGGAEDPGQGEGMVGRWGEIGPAIFSVWELGENRFSAVVIYRAEGAAIFSEREARLVHIVLSEVPWLHETGWSVGRSEEPVRLPARELVVLNLLLRGESRKAISDALAISVNTVASYARDTYRRFGVRSQAELIHRFKGRVPMNVRNSVVTSASTG